MHFHPTAATHETIVAKIGCPFSCKFLLMQSFSIRILSLKSSIWRNPSGVASTSLLASTGLCGGGTTNLSSLNLGQCHSVWPPCDLIMPHQHRNTFFGNLPARVTHQRVTVSVGLVRLAYLLRSLMFFLEVDIKPHSARCNGRRCPHPHHLFSDHR